MTLYTQDTTVLKFTTAIVAEKKRETIVVENRDNNNKLASANPVAIKRY